MVLGSLGLAFLAGLLSVLSPCVLPLLPIVLGAAASEHRMGPAALAAGVVLSFVAVGLFVATVGFALGLDADLFRNVGAILMIGVGVVLAMPSLQVRLATAGGPISNWADHRASAVQSRGPLGQFAIGLLLGAVWSSLRRPNAGRRLPACGARKVAGAGGLDHDRFRRRRGRAAGWRRVCFATGAGAASSPGDCQRQRGKNRVGRPAHRSRRDDCQRSRSAP